MSTDIERTASDAAGDDISIGGLPPAGVDGTLGRAGAGAGPLERLGLIEGGRIDGDDDKDGALAGRIVDGPAVGAR